MLQFFKIIQVFFFTKSGLITPVIFTVLVVCFLSVQPGFAQDAVTNNAFQVGEHLNYRLNYSSSFGEFNAGIADIDIGMVKEKNIADGHTVFHIVASGKSNSFFDIIFKVRDHFETYFDSATLLPYRFVRQTHEGNYIFNDQVDFNRKKGVAINSRKEIPIPPHVHDIISVVYFMRTLSVKDFGPDSTYYFYFYLDDSVYYSMAKLVGHETLETKWGWIPCLKIKPMMATGEVFAEKYPLTMWVTDDKNHIPLRAESKIIVGSVRMELSGFSGLKSPMIKSFVGRNKKRVIK